MNRSILPLYLIPGVCSIRMLYTPRRKEHACAAKPPPQAYIQHIEMFRDISLTLIRPDLRDGGMRFVILGHTQLQLNAAFHIND